MNPETITIPGGDIRRLLASQNGDGALLYLYIANGGRPEDAQQALGMTQSRFQCAAAVLRQLGLWPETKTPIPVGQRPGYTEGDVIAAMDSDRDFKLLYGEIQRLLGRSLNTEELKILLSFTRYLGLPGDVISVLVSYCKERARQKGSLRNPSLRTIEKEAYRWAENGIDTLQEAAAFLQAQNLRTARLQKVADLLQLRGRNLTADEERYITGWVDMGFTDEAIALAYERTCLNTGSLRWPYMNKILLRWHEAGLHTREQAAGENKQSAGKGRKLDAEEQAAIQRMLQEVN